MLDKTEFDFIEKIITLTTKDKLTWFVNGNQKLTSNDLYFTAKEYNAQFKDIEIKKYKVDFDLYETLEGFKLDCFFSKENAGIYKTHSSFSLTGSNEVTMEYKVLERLHKVIITKIETKEEIDKRNDIISFIDYRF